MKKRKFPIGCENGHFRVYAPLAKSVEVVSEAGITPLQKEKKGYFSGYAPGKFYYFRLNRSDRLYPDPASRFQPAGPFGPSQVIETYTWKNLEWQTPPIGNLVFYEMHIGTFTLEGTFKAAEKELHELKDLGIDIIELMPVNGFSGRFGWGYDGVNFFAPHHHYGTPEALKSFIDTAHGLKMGVILDVVYNHFGPEGNFLSSFSPFYESPKKNEWGKGLHFDHFSTREFLLTNVRYWLEEYRLDGIRVDATQAIEPSFLKAISHAAKGKLVIGENEPGDAKLIKEDGFDAIWNDDFHHSARIALGKKRQAYFTDYLGHPQELISCLKYGCLYQGQYYSWQKKNRGSPGLDLKPETHIFFLQNHDQVANTGGKRIGRLPNYKALATLLLLCTSNPMLFQGQEFASRSPFPYFADFKGKLARAVYKGRQKFLSQFKDLFCPDPCQEALFLKAKLNFSERKNPLYHFHKTLIRLRPKSFSLEGAVLDKKAFVIRMQGRLLLFNLGKEKVLTSLPEPLLAPPSGKKWKLLFSTTPVKFNSKKWVLPAHSAIVLYYGRNSTSHSFS